MPKVYIDGVEFEYQDSPMLLQFALDNGVDIPFFCYHPAMSIPTNCRMCLVETGTPIIDRATGQPVLEENGSVKIMWGRKPSTACNTPLSPGMVVKTHKTSEIVEKAQKGVLEFMLINHPLDCPICDQAGECPLQINTYKYGPEGSRFELQKVHKPKRVNLGPRVVLDAERCINCTRCVRFSEEITKSNQLSIISRGDTNFPAAAPGMVFDDPYSMNVIDICPVGALTSDEFRFKARVWEMNFTPAICTSCSNGCNIDAWVRDNNVLRLTPRENLDVNQYWMCDEGRLNISKYNDKRVSGIKTKGDVPVSFEQGLQLTVDTLKSNKGKLLFVGSAHSTVETQFALKAFAHAMGESNVFYVKNTNTSFGDNFLKKNDLAPNTAGAELNGFKAITLDELKDRVSKADVIYVVEDDRVLEELSLYFSSKTFIAQAFQYVKGFEHIQILLPAATSFEGNGVFINSKGLPQVTYMAKQVKQMTPEMWMSMSKSRLDAGGQPTDNWRHAENIVDCLPGWMLISLISHLAKVDIHFGSHAEIFAKIKHKFEVLHHIKLSKRNRKESFKQSQLVFAQK